MIKGDAKKAYQRQYMANRRKTASQDALQSTNDVRPDALDPVLLDPKPAPDIRPKRCRVLADLPESVQADIVRINKWCEDSHILDDLQQRIAIACEYQNQFPSASVGRESHQGLVDTGDRLVPGNRDIYQRPDGSQYIIDACSNKHEWPEVLSTVNVTGRPRNIAQGALI